MPSYNSSKIYRIEPTVPHDDNEIYIGSTTAERLCQRFAKHKSSYKMFKKGMSRVSVYELFDKYGVDNFEIILIESVNAKSRDELHAREGYYIKNTMNVNKVVAGRTDQQYKKDNKEMIREQDRLYRIRNDEIIKERNKVYCQAHPDKIKEAKMKWVKNNGEKIKCQCGSVIAKYNLARQHSKTIKHQTYLQNNINNSINETD